MQHFINNYGLIAVFVLMVAESAALPIPSELVMTFAGFLVSTGKMSFVGAVAAGSLGNLVGSYITWIIGRYAGRAIILRVGRYVLLREDDLAKAERWFERRGELAVFVARMLPVVRTFVSLPAGAAEMPLLRFGIYTLLGSIPFNLALVAAGYALGSSYDHLAKDIQYVGYVIGVVIVVGLVYFFYRRFQARKLAGGTGS